MTRTVASQLVIGRASDARPRRSQNPDEGAVKPAKAAGGVGPA